jgi:hypothetical protein
MDEKEIKHQHAIFAESLKFQGKFALQTLKLLFLLNGVAAVTFLGFISHKSSETFPIYWSLGVFCFSFGVVLTICTNFSAYCYQSKVTEYYGTILDRTMYVDIYDQEDSRYNKQEVENYLKDSAARINDLSPKIPCLTIVLGLASVGFFFAGVLFIFHGFNVS